MPAPDRGRRCAGGDRSRHWLPPSSGLPVAGRAARSATVQRLAARTARADRRDQRLRRPTIRAVGEQAQADQCLAAVQRRAGPCPRSRSPSAASDIDQRRALLCLTQAVYYEAGFEPLDGAPRGRPGGDQPACATRRSRSRFAGSSTRARARGVCQFSFVCDGSLYRAPAHAAWREAEASPRRRWPGYVETLGRVGHSLSRRLCRAALGADADQDRRSSGTHIFYRWPGAWGQPRGLHRPLYRRAARSAVDASAAAPGRASTPGEPPDSSPKLAGPPIPARRQ